jgi:hypothetical protein
VSAPEETSRAARAEDEYFVGYLPTPPGLRRFHFAVVTLAVIGLIGIASVLASSASSEHGHFGGGEADFVGVFSATPVPVLRVASAEGGVRTFLVVRGGKSGLPAAQVAEHDGHVVRLRGGLVERDGLGMIEVYQPIEAAEIDVLARAQIDDRAQSSMGHVALEGELVDSKCWLGRMHPGAGRTHRACAQQCVAGGIPAILVVRRGDGSETPYVLAGVEGDATQLAILELIADPVHVEGMLRTDGDLLVLDVEPASLGRR